jgi:hypothetical protein
MLAFDIETTGLKPGRDMITIVCTEDFKTGQQKAYEFGRLQAAGDVDGYERAKSEMIEELTAATTLCAFNGLAFDIPFIAKTFQVDEDVVASWKRKLSDIFVYCKRMYMHTFSLNLLCEKNNVPVKISSGLQAIEWAREQNWDALKEYCEADVAILNKLYTKRHLLNPRNNALMDLKFIAKEPLYDNIEATPLAKAQQSIDTFVSKAVPARPLDDTWEDGVTRKAAPEPLAARLAPEPGCTPTCVRQRMNLLAN